MTTRATAHLIGCLNDPRLRHTRNGLPILELTLAGDAPTADGKKTLPYYVGITILGAYAKFLAPLLQHGAPANVIGEVHQDRWTDARGQRRSVTRITAHSLVMLDDPIETREDRRGRHRLVGARNEVLVIGNLTHDADARRTPKGHLVARVPLAVNGRRAAGETTTYLNVTAWHQLAYRARTLRAGDLALIEGHITNEKWTDSEGRRRFTCRIEASRVDPLRRHQQDNAPIPSHLRTASAGAAAHS